MLTVDGRRAPDRGESLIEILLTIMIVGLASTSILAAIGIGIKAAGQTKAHNKVMATLRSYGEALSDIGDIGDTSYAASRRYVNCQSASGFASASTLGVVTGGLTLTVDKVYYWNGTQFLLAGATGSVCPGTDLGLQKVTLSANGASMGFPDVKGSLDVYIRRPCRVLSPAAGAC